VRSVLGGPLCRGRSCRPRAYAILDGVGPPPYAMAAGLNAEALRGGLGAKRGTPSTATVATTAAAASDRVVISGRPPEAGVHGRAYARIVSGRWVESAATSQLMFAGPISSVPAGLGVAGHRGAGLAPKRACSSHSKGGCTRQGRYEPGLVCPASRSHAMCVRASKRDGRRPGAG
jgi:hypothetical protein